MTEPISCSLTPEALRAGRAGLLPGLPGLAGLAATRDATPDGYRLTFAATSGTLERIALVIDAERQCCRWLKFGLEVPPAGGPIALTLSGPEGAKDFLAALFAA